MGPLQMGQPGGVAPGGGPSGPVPQSQNAGSIVYQQQPLSNSMDNRPTQPMQSNVSTVSSAGAGGPVGEPTKVPTLQSNMYKMQRNRTLKRSYVDVFNPSGAAPSKPTEPVLAPAVPTIPNAPGSFFVPGGGAEQQADNVAEVVET
uniref:Uncharacterized protein n=1 Tax=Anopheles maculatus TaxID=74869 RepID=A0A182SH95_9DIPT